MWDTHLHLSSRWTIISLFFCHTIFNIGISLIVMYQVTVDINPKYKGKKWTVNNWLFYYKASFSFGKVHSIVIIIFLDSIMIYLTCSSCACPPLYPITAHFLPIFSRLKIHWQQCFFLSLDPIGLEPFFVLFLLLNFTTLD